MRRIVSWKLRSAFPAAWRRQDDCTGPKALIHRSGECHIYQYWPRIRDSEEPLLRNPALASGPSRSKSKKLRRPQCPGNHSRTRARFRFSPGDSPSRIASCHRRRRIRHSASPKASHVCAEITVRHNIARRNRKLFVPCEQTVDDETLLWSPEENRREIAPRYHAVALQLLPSLNRSSLRIAVHLGNDYRAFAFSMKSAKERLTFSGQP